jgi:MFS family permease
MLTTTGGLDVNDMGPVWAVNTSLIVLLQLVVLRRISGRSRTKLLAFVCATWSLSWVINGFGVVTHTAVFAMACLSTAVFAVGETVWSPIGAALQNEIAPEHLRGRYNAVGALAWVISGSIGPLISGFMLQRNLVTEWIGMLVALLALAAVVILRMRKVLTAAEDGILEGH